MERQVSEKRQIEEESQQRHMQEMIDKGHATVVKMAESMISKCETEKSTFQRDLQAKTAHTQNMFVKDVEASVQAQLNKVSIMIFLCCAELLSLLHASIANT